MKYLYFPGCKIPTHLPQYDLATRAVLSALQVELTDAESTCCGYPVRHRSFEASVFSAARVLAVADRENAAILTPCKCCFGNLKHAAYWLAENGELRDRVDRLLAAENLSMDALPDVMHLLTVLTEDVGLEQIKTKVTRPLEGLRVAAHYGCHALRPSNVVQFDNPLAPTIFERLISVTGAQTADWELRLDCCGAPLSGKNDSLALKLMRRKIDDALEAGADILCTACTYCQIQFDTVRAEISDMNSPDAIPLPSVLYPQLLGLALGIGGENLGLDRNRIKWEYDAQNS